MRIIYETEDGRQYYDALSAQKHEEKLDLTEIKGIEMYDAYDRKLKINDRDFRRANKIVINDINDLPLFKKKIKPLMIKFSGEESEGTWLHINLLDTGASKWAKSRSKEEIARLVENGKKADIFIRDGVYAAIGDNLE